MSMATDAVGMASVLAALLFLFSLRSGSGAHFLAGAGVLILAAASIYSADVLNLPNALAALAVGAASGFLIGRRSSVEIWPSLMAVIAGVIGLAAFAMAIAIRLNPFAFGLIGETASHIAVRTQASFFLTIFAGGLAAVAGGVALFSRGGKAPATLAVSLAGWTVSGAAFLLDNPALAVAGGVTGSAGLVLAVRHAVDISLKGLADKGPHP